MGASGTAAAQQDRARQEKQILALALANPGLGPRRLAAHLAFDQANSVSASGVLRVLRRPDFGTRLHRSTLQRAPRPHVRRER